MLAQLRRPGGGSAECAKAAGSIDERRGQMRYDEYLARGLPIGSGRAEAACKTVVGRRMKCTGMRWSVAGANPVLWVRYCTSERLVRRLAGRPPAVGRMRRSVFTHQTFVAHPAKGVRRKGGDKVFELRHIWHGIGADDLSDAGAGECRPGTGSGSLQ